MNFSWIKTLIIASAAVMSTNCFAQDLIARQAPIDRKLKSVDSLALRRQIRAEQASYPALSLYPEWNNRYLSSKDAFIPKSYTIDLRGFCMPTRSRLITSPFGPRWRRMHKGLDIKVNIGDTIVAAFSGKVRIVQYESRGYGKYIVIRHYNGLETVYGHLSKQLVHENETVKAGEPIGLGGSTGHSTGSHLHFETRLLGIAMNPALMFNFPMQDVVADTYTFHSSGSNKFDNERDSRTNNDVIRYVRVKRGDTLASISHERGVTVGKLCELNRINKSTKLRPGQIIRCS
jgi:murein DD-endopeptidase MepM/ murein hydrolase activator NlpD